MNSRDLTCRLLRAGLSPGNIAKGRGLTLSTVLAYLDQAIGQGKLRRSDVYFSLPPSVRSKCAGVRVRPAGVEESDWKVYRQYGDAKHALGDMYNDLRFVEVTLHDLIRTTLVKQFGEAESGWWRKGVPENTRKSCQNRREEDSEPAASAFCYTDLIDLARILEVHWLVFSGILNEPYASNRKRLLNDLTRLNGIRRMVMHPVRGTTPSEDDFLFVRRLKLRLFPESSGAAEEAAIQELRKHFRAVVPEYDWPKAVDDLED